MVEYAIGGIQEVERGTTNLALEVALLEIVDKHIRLTDAIGSAESNPQVKKKKGDKSATANSAFKDGF
jgi:hypothetical protein